MTVRVAAPVTVSAARSVAVRAVLASVLTVLLGGWFAVPGQASDHVAAPVALVGEATVALPAAAKDARITINVAQVAVDTVSVSGTLATSDGRPLKAAVSVSIDGRLAGVAATGADGAYNARVPGVTEGRHTATVAYGGSSAVNPGSASQSFTMAARVPTTPAESARATASAPPAGSASVLTAKVSPTAVTGGYVDVSGTLRTSANTPIDRGRIEVATSWGGATGAGATDAEGSFSVSVGLPAVPEGQAPPASMTVTVTYPGDGRYAAATATYPVSLAAPGPTPPPPKIRSEAPAPPAQKGSAAPAPSAPAGVVSVGLDEMAGSAVAVLAVVLAVGAVAVLAAMAAVAWRRSHLLPGERRGFGTDFGK